MLIMDSSVASLTDQNATLQQLAFGSSASAGSDLSTVVSNSSNSTQQSTAGGTVYITKTGNKYH